MADTLAAIRSAVGYVGLGAKVTATAGQLSTSLAGVQAGTEISGAAGLVTGPVAVVGGALGLAQAKTTVQYESGAVQVATGALATATAIATYIGAAIASTLAAITAVLAAPLAVVAIGFANAQQQEADKIKGAIQELHQINRDLPVIVPQLAAPLRFLPLVRFIPLLKDENEQIAILQQYNGAGVVAESGGAGWSSAQAILEGGNAVRHGQPLPTQLKDNLSLGSFYGILLRLITQDILARRAKVFWVSYPLGVIGKEQVVWWLSGNRTNIPTQVITRVLRPVTITYVDTWDSSIGTMVQVPTPSIPQYLGYGKENPAAYQYVFSVDTGEPIMGTGADDFGQIVGTVHRNTPLTDAQVDYYLATEKPGVSLQAIMGLLDSIDHAAFRQSEFYQTVVKFKLLETLARMTPANARQNVERILAARAAGAVTGAPEAVQAAVTGGPTSDAYATAVQLTAAQQAEADFAAANAAAMSSNIVNMSGGNGGG